MFIEGKQVVNPFGETTTVGYCNLKNAGKLKLKNTIVGTFSIYLKCVSTGSVAVVSNKKVISPEWERYIFYEVPVDGEVDFSEGEYYLYDAKFESGSKATSYTPSPEDDPIMYDNVIYDTSGYGNNGSVSGTIAWDNDSPRYKGAYDFNQTGYIKNSNFNISFKEFTISYWIKIPESITAQHFAFGTFNSWTGNGIGSWRDLNLKGYSTIIKSDGETSYGSFNQVKFTPNTWYFVSFVYTGTTLKTYINGKIYGNIITYGKNGNVNMPVVYLGNSLFNNSPSSETDECSMVDFRIYATALNNQTIEELYKVGASVDSSGNLYAYDFNEN